MRKILFWGAVRSGFLCRKRKCFDSAEGNPECGGVWGSKHPDSFITSLEEIRAVKVQLKWAAQELREEGRQFNSENRLGVMIETAAAVVMADRLAAETDFSVLEPMT